MELTLDIFLTQFFDRESKKLKMNVQELGYTSTWLSVKQCKLLFALMCKHSTYNHATSAFNDATDPFYSKEYMVFVNRTAANGCRTISIERRKS